MNGLLLHLVKSLKIIQAETGVYPTILQADNGEFSNGELDKFCEDNNIQLIHGRARHPQSQGAVEAVNKTIKVIIDSLILLHPNMTFAILVTTANTIYNGRQHGTIAVESKTALETCDDVCQIIRIVSSSHTSSKINLVSSRISVAEVTGYFDYLIKTGKWGKVDDSEFEIIAKRGVVKNLCDAESKLEEIFKERDASMRSRYFHNISIIEMHTSKDITVTLEDLEAIENVAEEHDIFFHFILFTDFGGRCWNDCITITWATL